MPVGFINPEEQAEPAGWTHVITCDDGKLAFISGVVAVDKVGNMVGKGDLSIQALNTFENLKIALDAVGASPKDLFQQILGLEKGPASVLIGVTSFFLDELLVEIEGVAVVE